MVPNSKISYRNRRNTATAASYGNRPKIKRFARQIAETHTPVPHGILCLIMAMQMLIPYVLVGFALGLLGLTSCKPTTDTPTTQTVTKNVTVEAIPFVVGTTLSFAPSYIPDGGWDTNFHALDITSLVSKINLH
jgi:hypothetical protein